MTEAGTKVWEAGGVTKTGNDWSTSNEMRPRSRKDRQTLFIDCTLPAKTLRGKEC